MAASGLSIKERLEEAILAHPDEISALKLRCTATHFRFDVSIH